MPSRCTCFAAKSRCLRDAGATSVHVLWDLENCAVPRDVSVDACVAGIRSAVTDALRLVMRRDPCTCGHAARHRAADHQAARYRTSAPASAAAAAPAPHDPYVREVVFKAFLLRSAPVNDRVLLDLQHAGVDTHHVLNPRRKAERVDFALVQHFTETLLRSAHNPREHVTLVLVSGDQDFFPWVLMAAGSPGFPLDNVLPIVLQPPSSVVRAKQMLQARPIIVLPLQARDAAAAAAAAPVHAAPASAEASAVPEDPSRFAEIMVSAAGSGSGGSTGSLTPPRSATPPPPPRAVPTHALPPQAFPPASSAALTAAATTTATTATAAVPIVSDGDARQQVRRRILQLLQKQGGRMFQPQVVPAYEQRFGEYLDYKVLGYGSLGALLRQVPGVEVVRDGASQIVRLSRPSSRGGTDAPVPAPSAIPAPSAVPAAGAAAPAGTHSVAAGAAAAATVAAPVEAADRSARLLLTQLLTLLRPRPLALSELRAAYEQAHQRPLEAAAGDIGCTVPSLLLQFASQLQVARDGAQPVVSIRLPPDLSARLCTLVREHNGSVPMESVVPAYVARFKQPLNYKALGHAKLISLVNSLPELAVHSDGSHVLLRLASGPAPRGRSCSGGQRSDAGVSDADSGDHPFANALRRNLLAKSKTPYISEKFKQSLQLLLQRAPGQAIALEELQAAYGRVYKGRAIVWEPWGSLEGFLRDMPDVCEVGTAGGRRVARLVRS